VQLAGPERLTGSCQKDADRSRNNVPTKFLGFYSPQKGRRGGGRMKKRGDRAR